MSPQSNGLTPRPGGPFFVDFTFLCVCSAQQAHQPPQSKDLPCRLIGNSKLSISVDGCLSSDEPLTCSESFQLVPETAGIVSSRSVPLSAGDPVIVSE